LQVSLAINPPVWQFVKLEKFQPGEEESNVDGRENWDFSGDGFQKHVRDVILRRHHQLIQMFNFLVQSILRIEPHVWQDVLMVVRFLAEGNSNSNASVLVKLMVKKFVDGSVARHSGMLPRLQA